MTKFLPEGCHIINRFTNAALAVATFSTLWLQPEISRYVKIYPDECLAVSAIAVICNFASIAAPESRDVAVYVANSDLGNVWINPSTVSLEPRMIHWFDGMTAGLVVFSGLDHTIHAVMRGNFLSTFVDA